MNAASAAIEAMFKETVKEVDKDKILTPITRAELLNPKFKGFTLKVEGWEPRPYDGKFHPSAQSNWDARQLYFYLTRPDLFEPEQMTLTSVLAITQGKFWHKFLQKLWKRHGILQIEEVPLRDPKHNLTGHMDGLTTIMHNGNFEGLEIKTMNDFKLPKVTCTEELIALYPGYYSQTQDYLMMSGLPFMRYFIMAMSTPYPMSEFVVAADPEFQAQQRAKYRLALDRAALGYPPPACCALRSAKATSCPVKAACEIGRLS